MKILRPILLLIMILSGVASSAATVPAAVNNMAPVAMGPQPKKLTVKDIERLTGKKLTLLQKLQVKILLGKLRKRPDSGEITSKQRRQARLSMILGISSIVLLFLPVLSLLAVPAAIVGLIMGISSLKGNSNTEGIVGVVTSGVVLALILIVLILVISLFSGFGVE